MPIPDINLADSNFGRLLEFVRNEIVGLALPGIPNESVAIAKEAWLDPTETQPPYITVTPRPEVVDWNQGTNERDDPNYSVQVSMIFANGRDVSSYMMGTQLSWRQTIRKKFHNKSPNDLTGLTFASGESFLRSYVEPGEVYLEPAKRMMYDAQYLMLRFLVRESRS